jgi:SPP1 gp7 family putative phage head morphogenesis protein
MAKILKPIDRERASRGRFEKSLADRVELFFEKNKSDIISPLLSAYKPEKAMKALTPDQTAEIEQLLLKLDLSAFKDLPKEVQEIYEGLAKDGMLLTVRQMEDVLSEEAFAVMLGLVNDKAVEMALTQSANLVGMKWVDGKLVVNPKSEWAISESTRDAIRGDVSRAIQEGQTTSELRKALMESTGFSRERADMIARTEVADMDIKSQQETWKDSELVKEKAWMISEAPCDDCLANYNQGRIAFDEDFENGDPPVHPNCTCDIAAILED